MLSVNKLLSLTVNTIRKNIVHPSFAVAMAQSQFSTDVLKVEHDKKNHKFVIKLGDAEALLEYTENTHGVLNMYHTEVPPALQGKGIAKLLAQEAFGYVINNDKKMKLTCSYLAKYYKDNPKEEYKKHVV